jgi:uridine kinase
MKIEQQTKLIAIVGGSGSGKSWFASEMNHRLEPLSTVLSLDDFYYDLSKLTPEARDAVNYDHPQTIDWPLFESVLDDCLMGRVTGVPQYDFKTHTRLPMISIFQPAPLVLVEGLWVLHVPKLRSWFSLKIFLDCPESLRMKRRLVRDVTGRGRTPDSVKDQFNSMVAPMHDRFVAPQAACADITLKGEPGEFELRELREILQYVALETHEPRIAANF